MELAGRECSLAILSLPVTSNGAGQ